MRILVTGGAGFIGSHLCDDLVADGHDVTVFDNLFTGCRDNILRHIERGKVEFVRFDITHPFSDHFDAIYHLACPAAPLHYSKNPLRTIETAFLGTRNVLENALRSGARVLHVSTSEVYGDPEVHPQPERYEGKVSLYGPRACYDEGKRAAEVLCFIYCRLGVDVRVARVFNTYGPRMSMDDGRVIPTFVREGLLGQSIPVHGDGLQTRSFCHVSDTVRALRALMQREIFRGPFPFNVGNPEETSIMGLAEMIALMTGAPGISRQPPLLNDDRDPRRRCPDISRIRDGLGWEPEVALKDGLLTVLEDMKNRLKLR